MDTTKNEIKESIRKFCRCTKYKYKVKRRKKINRERNKPYVPPVEQPHWVERGGRQFH